MAFFIPMFIMVPSYVMTVRLLSARAKFVRNDSLQCANLDGTSNNSNTLGAAGRRLSRAVELVMAAQRRQSQANTQSQSGSTTTSSQLNQSNSLNKNNFLAKRSFRSEGKQQLISEEEDSTNKDQGDQQLAKQHLSIQDAKFIDEVSEERLECETKPLLAQAIITNKLHTSNNNNSKPKLKDSLEMSTNKHDTKSGEKSSIDCMILTDFSHQQTAQDNAISSKGLKTSANDSNVYICRYCCNCSKGFTRANCKQCYPSNGKNSTTASGKRQKRSCLCCNSNMKLNPNNKCAKSINSLGCLNLDCTSEMKMTTLSRKRRNQIKVATGDTIKLGLEEARELKLARYENMQKFANIDIGQMMHEIRNSPSNNNNNNDRQNSTKTRDGHSMGCKLNSKAKIELNSIQINGTNNNCDIKVHSENLNSASGVVSERHRMSGEFNALEPKGIYCYPVNLMEQANEQMQKENKATVQTNEIELMNHEKSCSGSFKSASGSDSEADNESIITTVNGHANLIR